MAEGIAASAFHPSLPGGRASGSLRVWEHGLVFTRHDGGPAVTLPLAGLELRRGGASDRLLFCTHAACPGWQVYTAEVAAVITAPALAGHPALAALGAARRRRHLHAWGYGLAGLGALVLAGLLLWWSLDGISALAARRVPAEMEASLGETVMQQYKLGKELMDDKAARPLLAPLTDPLAAAMGGRRHALHFHIVNDPAINAFALPGGYVVINSGLILKARRASELQGVLGHEIAHVSEQHGLRAVIRSTGLFVVAQALLGDASGVVAVLANAGPLLINQAYSRDFERAADAEGVALLKRAKVDPHGMVAFFEIILEEERRQMAKVTDANARRVMEASRSFLGTHPETPERIATLRKTLEQEPRTGWRDDEAAFRALQDAVRAFVAASDRERDTAGDKAGADNREPVTAP